jgi:hypothetical protein
MNRSSTEVSFYEGNTRAEKITLSVLRILLALKRKTVLYKHTFRVKVKSRVGNIWFRMLDQISSKVAIIILNVAAATRQEVRAMPLDEEYFVWLYSQVGSVKTRNRSKTYWKLLRLLYAKEFTWSDIEMDENRAQDGRDLRLDFLHVTGREVNGNPGEWMDMGCSFLELLIALSRKLAFEADGAPADWFWILISNLGLHECTDAYPPDPRIIDEILDKVIDRKYAPNGAGGLFPLQHTNEDQRVVELWYQAQAYLLERI